MFEVQVDGWRWMLRRPTKIALEGAGSGIARVLSPIEEGKLRAHVAAQRERRERETRMNQERAARRASFGTVRKSISRPVLCYGARSCTSGPVKRFRWTAR